jgi:hypothetical protein
MPRYSTVREITRMCAGFVLGYSEAHTLSHSAVSDPLLYLWTRNLVRQKAWQWAPTLIKSILPSSVRLCKVNRGILKIAPRHIYQDMALRFVARAPSGSGKSVLFAIPWRERSYARTGFIVLDIGPTLRVSCQDSDLPYPPPPTKWHSLNGPLYS